MIEEGEEGRGHEPESGPGQGTSADTGGPTRPPIGAQHGKPTDTSFMVAHPDAALGVRITGEGVGAESGEAGFLGTIVERTSRLLERTALTIREGVKIPRPELATVAFGASVEIGFVPPRVRGSDSEDEQATIEAARKVAAVIDYLTQSVSGLVAELGGEGESAFEDLLEALSDGDAALDWHARGRDAVTLSGPEARNLLFRLRESSFTARQTPGPGIVGLVLAAGGARGAYEAGALSVLMPALDARGELPRVLVGAGSGAINAAFLASRAHMPVNRAVNELVEFWRSLDRAAVYRRLITNVSEFQLGFLARLLGLPSVDRRGLLDASPLLATIDRAIDWRNLYRNVRQREVEGLAVIALSVRSGRSVVFTQGAQLPRPHRGIDYVNVEMSATHLMASASLPFLLPPIEVTSPEAARGFYMHGATRLKKPLVPALALGADRVVVVSTEPLLDQDWEPEGSKGEPDGDDTFAELLQGAIADQLVDDVWTMASINELLPRDHRRVPYLFAGPRVPGVIGKVTSDLIQRRYSGITGLLSGEYALLSRLVGRGGPKHGEFMSNIIFDPPLTESLIEVGRRDALDAMRTDWQVETPNGKPRGRRATHAEERRPEAQTGYDA